MQGFRADRSPAEDEDTSLRDLSRMPSCHQEKYKEERSCRLDLPAGIVGEGTETIISIRESYLAEFTFPGESRTNLIFVRAAHSPDPPWLRDQIDRI